MAGIVYTNGQETAWQMFAKFYLSEHETVFVLKGYSGTGKSTVVARMIQELTKLNQMRQLVDPDWVGLEVCVTATTNQAALSLSQATSGIYETGTIHSLLGLRVMQQDYRQRGKTKLVATRREKLANKLIFIDEVSYIDQDLLRFIFSETENCKIVFIGDPAQLTPIGSNYMPVFQMTNNMTELTEPVRFDEGPIATMVHNFRDTVVNDNWHKLQLTPGVIDHVGPDEFKEMALHAFQNESQYGITKMLAFHNACVIDYNNTMSGKLLGTTELQAGQRVQSNGPAVIGKTRVVNNEEVLIESIQDGERYGVAGKEIVLKNKGAQSWFMPNSRAEGHAAHRKLAAADDYTGMQEIIDEWVDLRPDFAKTVNKSQGSTYDTTFIDLGDIYRGTRTANQLARYLYVGCSRTRSRLILTGDLG